MDTNMPSIDIHFLQKLKDDYHTYPNFIETGTYLGDTIREMEDYFISLHTIEINKDLYEKVVTEYKGKKIKFYWGDSSIVLQEMLPKINGKSIIFLDGHWSAGITGRGQKDCPLYEELTNIIQHHKEEAIIIIDDVRLFGKGPSKGNEQCNWEDINIENIIQITESRLTKQYFLHSNLSENDRLIIHIK